VSFTKNFIVSNLLVLIFVIGCGGGGGGGGSPTPSEPSPTSSLSASSSSVLIDTVVTLTWSSTNATSCTASGTWNGSKATNGTEDVTISTPGNNQFTITCSGAGGSQAASVTVEGYRNTEGVTVDGYIRQADIFIDTNDSYTADSGEDTTTSDNDGKFTIKYSNGNLISLGGTDLDSGNALDNLLIVHKLTGHSNFKAVTPVTSVAAFMADPSLVNAALGIDASLDIATVDPVAGKGDSGINDYLYEKGNQLTVLAYALQNITNNLNTTTDTTQDYFKAIAEETDTEYAATGLKVDIETEAFITKVIDNIIAAKTLTVAEEARTNLISALSSVMPVIEVKSSDTLTTAVFDFATSTLQTDAQAMANGTAAAETITSYQTDILNYVATDQNVDPDELAPNVVAIEDNVTTEEDTLIEINVLLNDSFISTAPITLSKVQDASNGTIEIENDLIIYTPDAHHNGIDDFAYSIQQGDKYSDADVFITIEAVNDAPTFDNLLSTISVPENQTGVTSINVVDVEEDQLTVSLLGDDKDSFNLSSQNVLTFKLAPDFETKNTYFITLSVTDGIATTLKDVTILVTNVNDVAPVFTSSSNFSAAENQLAIGTVEATDVEGDSITFSVSGSDIAVSESGVLTFVSAPDFETKTSYTTTITANDGINSTEQNITVSITNVNDVAPVFTSSSNFSAAENQLAIGTVEATDVEGDSITFSVSGSDIAVSESGVLTFVSAPDFETKTSYTTTITANDGINSTNQDVAISIENKLEDVISFDYSISDGSYNQAPVLTTSLVLDELTDAKSVYAILMQVNKEDISSNLNCSGASAVFPLEKSGNTWKITQELNAETSELCAYYLNYVINPYTETVETAPPTEGVHLSSGNKRMLDNDLQYSMYYYNAPGNGRGDLINISNPRSKNTFLSQNSYNIYYYSPSQTYPSGCTTRQYSFVVSGELIDTPLLAEPTPGCFMEMVTNTSSDSSKLKYEYYMYSLDKISNARSYLYSSIKDNGTRNIGGFQGRELAFVQGAIDPMSTNDERLVKFVFELDSAILSQSDEYLYIYAAFNDKSYRVIDLGDNIGTELSIPYIAGLGGDDADVTAPLINTVTIEPYSSSTEPDRDIMKFSVDIENTNNNGGAITSIRDLWINTQNPYCEQKVFYVRDDLDGKIDVNKNTISATIPFLKSQRGSYKIINMNINDHGLAETNYTSMRSYSGLTDQHPAIGQIFTVGDGTYPTCPLFSIDDFSTHSLDEGSIYIGTFTAQAGSLDSITYSLETADYALDPLTDMTNYININPATGELNYNTAPDYEEDGEDSGWNQGGDVTIVATSSSGKVGRVLITIVVNNINDNEPTITDTTYNADENQTFIGCLGTFDDDLDPIPAPTSESTCADLQQSGSENVKDQEPLTYSISGANLLIDANDGTLTFETAPDYETAQTYIATVTIYDGVYSTNENITVNVNDLNDNAPSVDNTSFTADENQNVAGQISINDPDSVNNFTYEIVSDFGDGASFSIDANGLITFNSNPDYESKSTYMLKVIISDGVYSITKEFTVTINDLDVEITQPSATSLNLLPKASNSISIQLEGSVLDGRTGTWSIDNNGSYGTATINNSGLVSYTTTSTDGATEEIGIKLSDGISADATTNLIITLNTDPLYKHQWHLDNTGQANFASASGLEGEDLNIKNSISAGYDGSNVIVSVMDEGLEILHEDLTDNIVANKSYNFVYGTYDPTSGNLDGDHGTSVAGIIASKGWNNKGGRGVAPNAGLVGYNILEYFTYSNEAWAWGLDNTLAQDNDIFNMSYGTRLYNNSSTFSFPNQLWLSSTSLSGLDNGINNLRDGKGGIYVKSMGNDFRKNPTNGYACGEAGVDDDGAMGCSIRFHDAQHIFPYTIGVGALGAGGVKSSYSTADPSIWVSGTGGEYGTDIDYGYSSSTSYPAIMTTDQSSCSLGYVGSSGRRYNAFNDDRNPHPENSNCNYVSTFNGTSSAAPSVAGGIAVLLDAYPNLSWRDVKHIIAKTSRKLDVERSYSRNDIVQYEWELNAAGYNHHYWYGFGAFDLDAAINYASSYISTLGTLKNYGWVYSNEDDGSSLNLVIPSFSLREDTISYNPTSDNNFVEFIQVVIYLDKDTPRDIGLSLVSPQETEINILQPFTNVSGNPNGNWFVIGVSGFYGENIKGDWKLKIVDYTNNDDSGILVNWGMNIYGN
jgi:hypothetical protein